MDQKHSPTMADNGFPRDGYAVSAWPDTRDILARLYDLANNQPIHRLSRSRLEACLRYFDTRCARSRALHDKAKERIPGGVQHNLSFNYPFPLAMARAQGPYLWDVDGNRYIDGVSSLWVLVHGHGKKELTEAIKKQADILCHSTLLGLANVPSATLAKRLIDIAPGGLEKVFYSDNGSTSVEIALKMAYQYWQQKGEKRRKKFVCLANGYHGDTIGSVSVGGIDLFHAGKSFGDCRHQVFFHTAERVPP